MSGKPPAAGRKGGGSHSDAILAVFTGKGHTQRAARVTARTAAAVVAAALLAALIAWLAIPSRSLPPGAGRVRQYLDVRACLLTGAGGVARGSASLAWASMESASTRSRAMVSYLPAAGTTAGPFLASLAQRQCRVIVTVGAPQARAVAADAARFRQIHFVVIAGPAAGPSRRASGRNVTQVEPASATAIKSAINQAIGTAVADGPAA